MKITISPNFSAVKRRTFYIRMEILILKGLLNEFTVKIIFFPLSYKLTFYFLIYTQTIFFNFLNTNIFSYLVNNN